ncbi:MAG: CRTAC1 family protein [Planctomycetaceae bacterium]
MGSKESFDLPPMKQAGRRLQLVAAIAALASFLSAGCRDVDPASVPASPAAVTEKTSTELPGSRPPATPVAESWSSADASRGPQPNFRDVAAGYGIEFQFFEDRVPGRYLLPEVMGGGVAWLDLDRDGWQDLFFTNGEVLDRRPDSPQVPGDRMFRNRLGERFEDVSVPSGGETGGYGQGAAAGDFDGDGFPDLFISNYGMDVLLRNNGDGTFTDVTLSSEIGDADWSTSAAWVDLNGDSLADVYCANYMDVTLANSAVCNYGGKPGYCGPGKFNGVHDAVWLNLGDGTFREASRELGLTTAASKGLALAVLDLDRDLRPEIYVANDMEANLLFTQTDVPAGGPVWRETASSAGAAVSADGLNEASMGVAAADYDGDRLPDLYLTHYYQMKNTLYRNLGGLLFEDDSLRTGVAATSLAYLGFGTIPLDYNLDHRPDVFIANGHVLGPAIEPSAMTPQLLRNTGTGFEDISRFAGGYFVDAWTGRGAAGCDFDHDGDTDIAVSHIDRPVSLLRNDTISTPRSLQVDLQRLDRVPVPGARVLITSADVQSEQSVSAGGSYLSTNDSALLFPLEADTADIEVTWPDGRVDRHAAIPAGLTCVLLPGRWYAVPR